MPRGRPPTATEALRQRLRREGRSTLDLATDREWLLRDVTAHPDQLLSDLNARHLAHRLQKGRYLVNVADDVRSEVPLVDALEPLAGTILARLGTPYYLSWHTALYHYGLLEQQASTVFCAVPMRKRSARFAGFKVSFITLPGSRFFGVARAKGYESAVRMASVEHALLDALERPELTAPFPLIVAAFADAAMSGMLNAERLVRYTAKMGSPALARRVGFLMERYGPEGGEQLQRHIGSRRYAVPLRTGGSRTEGELDSRWQVRVPAGLLTSAEQLK